jgi:voltage-gated potassium channel
MCSNLPESFQNKTIEEIGIRKNSGANIVGFKTPQGEFIINPSVSTKLIKDSKLFVLGTVDQISKMKEIIKFGGNAK